MIPQETEEDPFVLKMVNGFTGTVPETEDLLFPEDRERSLSIWDDVDWWSGESTTGKTAPSFKPQTFDKMTNTKSEQRLADERLEGATMGSPGSFAAAEAANMPSVKQGKTIRWFQQSNGEIPEKRLMKIAGGTHALRPDAALAFKAMKRAAKKDGVTITLTDSYRDLATQHRLAEEKGLYSQGGLAAEPGTSNHGWGLAVDIGEGEQRTWLARNGKRFGFATIAREPWHWEYEPTGDEEFKVPTKKKPKSKSTGKLVSKPAPGRDVGATDLSSTVPMSDPNGMLDAVMSLVEDEREVVTPRGKKRVNLSDAPAPKNQADIIQYARRLAKKYGWRGDEWKALYEIGMRESGWNPEADNPTSTAHGIPQRLMSSHPLSDAEKKKWKDPRYQVRWFLTYIKNRYGDPTAALQHHDREGWY